MISTFQNWVGKGKELVNWCFEKVSGTPIDVIEGRFWYDTNTKKPMYFDGTEAKQFNADVKKYGGIIDTTDIIWTDNGSGNITINQCNINIYDNANYDGELQTFTIEPASFTLIDGSNNLVVVDYNNGTPEYRLVEATSTNYNHSNIIPIYRFWYAFGSIHSAPLDSLGLGLAEKLVMRVGQTDYYHRVNNTGLMMSTIGSNNLSITASQVWAGPVLMDVLAYTSATDNCSYLYKNTSNVWEKVNTTTVPNTLYNPTGSGAVTLTNSSKYSCVYIYRSIGDTKEAFIILDTTEYNSRDNAIALSTPRTDLPNIIQSHCILIGRVIFKYNTTIVNNDMQSVFNTLFNAGSVSDHESLSNLLGGEASYHGHVTSDQNTKLVNSGNPNGYLVLDSLGYVPMGNIPVSLLGALRYQTTWDASTNTPALPALPDNTTKGYYWKVNVAGTYDGHTYAVGDFIISNGTSWDWCDNVDSVTSVFGRTGPVTAQAGDYTATQITNTPSGNISSTTVQAALNELDTEKAAKATTLAGYGITDAAPINATLVDNVASATLPVAGAATAITVLLQSIRDNLKSLFTKLSDGSVTKVGTATVGSASKPIYLNAGTPTAISATVGSATQPVYFNNGTPTAITGTITNATSGNAGTATKLKTARTITVDSNDMTATAVSFDGSANITIAPTLDATGVTAGSYTKLTVDAKGRVTAGASAGISDITGLPDALASAGSLSNPAAWITYDNGNSGLTEYMDQLGVVIASGSGNYSHAHLEFDVICQGSFDQTGQYSATVSLAVKNQNGTISASVDLMSGDGKAFENLYCRSVNTEGFYYLYLIARVSPYTIVSVRRNYAVGDYDHLIFANAISPTGLPSDASRVKCPITRNYLSAYAPWMIPSNETKGGYAGVMIDGMRRMTLMEDMGGGYGGIYDHNLGTWIILRTPSNTIQTGYVPPSNSDTDDIPTTSWVKDVAPILGSGFSAGTTHWYGALANRGYDSNTVYFCY